MVFLAAVDLPMSPSVVMLVHGAAAVTVLLILWSLWRIRDWGPPDLLGEETAYPLPLAEIKDAMRDVRQRYPADAIEYFAYVLYDIPHYLTRVDERMEIEESSFRIRTTMSFGTMRGRSQTLLVPLIQTGSTLIDELMITDADGAMVPTLSQYETRGLVASALEWLVDYARQQQAMGSTHRLGGTPGTTRVDQMAIDELLQAVCHVGPRTEQLDGWLDAVDRLDVPDVWRAPIRGFCDGLAMIYLIVGELARPPGRQVVVSYSQLVASENPEPHRWRQRFGMLPAILDSPPMAYAFRAQSYHFQLTAGGGRYVYDHRLEFARTRTVVNQKIIARYGQYYVRRHPQDGRSNAHCHIRRQNGLPATPPELKSVVQLREVPPGALGGAAVVAAAAAILTSFFAFTRIALDGPSLDSTASTNQQLLEVVKASVNADIPALLMALPAFSAILVGHWADATRLPKSSVSAYVGLLGTMVISLISAILFLLDANRRFASEVQLTVFDKQWHLHSDAVWLFLAGVAIVQAVYLWCALRIEMKYYLRLLASRA
jgi:hypothetical protein